MKHIILTIFTCCACLSEVRADEPAVMRITLHLDGFGNGKVTLSKTTDPPANTLKGEAFQFASMPKAKSTKGLGGVFRIEHDFADADNLDQITMAGQNVKTSPEEKALVFAPGSLDGKPELARFGYRWLMWSYMHGMT
jgi:hypothetical protein